MPAIAMQHKGDPKQELLDKLGDISGIEFFNTHVLCAIYMGSEITKGGIIRPGKSVDEGRYQSKIGLIVKMGPSAFIPSDGWWGHDDRPRVGDWVIFRASDGWDMDIGDVQCRMLTDTAIRGRIDKPDRLW
jgi:hypothetical protein